MAVHVNEYGPCRRVFRFKRRDCVRQSRQGATSLVFIYRADYTISVDRGNYCSVTMKNDYAVITAIIDRLYTNNYGRERFNLINWKTNRRGAILISRPIARGRRRKRHPIQIILNGPSPP